MTVIHGTNITIKNGKEAKIEGDEQAVDAIITALKKAGFQWNDKLGTWDQGFYK